MLSVVFQSVYIVYIYEYAYIIHIYEMKCKRLKLKNCN